MPCLVGILALMTPRLAVVLVWLFSDYIGRAVGDKVLVPVLAFLFMPLTLLAYCLAVNTHGSLEGAWWILVIGAALVDLGIIGGGAKKRRRREITAIR